MELIWSDSLLVEAEQTRRQLAAQLQRAGIVGEVVISGPAGLVGVLTRGDIDLQLRVPPEAFGEVVRALRALCRPASTGAWAPTLAVFEVPAARSTGLAVTPIGSVHDRRFTRSWQRLAAEPGLLAEYNALKREHVESPAYERVKSAFFDRIATDRDTG